MEAKPLPYDYEDRLDKIDKILDEKISLKTKTNFPSKDQLKHTSHYLVDVVILNVDIRSSSKLSNFLFKKRNDILVKLYKAYISEVIAVMKGCDNIVRVYIEGDGVWAVFSADNKQTDVRKVFNTAARIISLVDILNVKLIERKYTDITIGIGMDTGESLYVLGGYKYTNINEDVWLGNVVNNASKLCNKANKNSLNELVVSKEVYKYLDKEQRDKLTYSYDGNCYHGRVPNEKMQNWLVKHSPTYIRCEGDYCHYLTNRKSFKNKVMFALFSIILTSIIYMWIYKVTFIG